MAELTGLPQSRMLAKTAQAIDMLRLIFAIILMIPQSVCAQSAGEELAAAAASQVGVTIIYDPAYVGLEFPGGDIPRSRGVCSDVVIRALRDAWSLDLQRILNADMKANFPSYPKTWGLTATDRNIDHRRVGNLEVLFQRAGAALALTSHPAAFLPGDVISFRLSGSNLAHIGIIADATARDGTPLVTHNIGRGARTENMLFDHKIVGHFRLGEDARSWLRTR